MNKYGYKTSVDGNQRFPTPTFATVEQAFRAARMKLGLPIKDFNLPQLPYCYGRDPNYPGVLMPIESDFKLLMDALEYLKTCSYKEVASWLSRHASRPISYGPLYRVMRDRRPDPEILLPLEERQRIWDEKSQIPC